MNGVFRFLSIALLIGRSSSACLLGEGYNSLLHSNLLYLSVSFSFMLQEWHHIVVCILLGVAGLGFPLYELRNLPDGPFPDL